MSLTQELTRTGLEGFTNGLPAESPFDAHVIGSKGNVLVGPGKWRRWPGLGTSPVARSLASTIHAFLVEGQPAVASGLGMAAQYRSGAVVYSGDSGAVDWGDGSRSFTAVAANIMMLDLGTGTGGDPGPLGLPVPPKILDGVSGVPGDWEFVMSSSGDDEIGASFTIKVAAYRTETRGVSWTSVGSDYAVPTGSNRSFDLTLPDLSSTYPGTIEYKVYLSRQGFPEGPHYYWRTLAAGTHTGLSYTDADLTTVLAPYSQDTETIQTPSGAPGRYGMPPKARFTTVFGPCVVGIGTWDAPTGHLIHASTPFQMENFDPDNAVLLNPAEPVVGVVDAANDGYLILVQENAISALVLTGALTTPVIPRNIWKGTGARSAKQVCSVYGELYVWAKGKGLIRSGVNGDPSSQFTARVRGFLEGFTTDPIIGYDPATDRVCVIGLHSDPYGDGGGAAYVCLPYERGLDGDRWSDPLPLSQTPVSCVTYRNNLYIVTSGGVLYQVFGSGGLATGGSGNGDSVHQYMPSDGGAPFHEKTVVQFAVSATASTVDVAITGEHDNAAEDSYSSVACTRGHSGILHCFAPFLHAFSAKVTVPQAAGEATVSGVLLRFEIDDGI
jgi:hypothetical protein